MLDKIKSINREEPLTEVEMRAQELSEDYLRVHSDEEKVPFKVPFTVKRRLFVEALREEGRFEDAAFTLGLRRGKKSLVNQ